MKVVTSQMAEWIGLGLRIIITAAPIAHAESR